MSSGLMTVKYYELSARLHKYYFKQYEVIKTKSLLKELMENTHICTAWYEPHELHENYTEAEFRKINNIYEYKIEIRRLTKYREFLETIDFEKLDICLSPYTSKQKTLKEKQAWTK